MRARVTTPAGERTITTPLLGRGNLSNALAAIAVSLELGVAFDAVTARIATLEPATRRGAVRLLRDGVRLVDDSYNSSPSALRRALEAIGHQQAAGRRIAVLGEMLELGEHALALHRACGAAVVAAGVSRLFVIGGAAARALGDAAVEAGLPAAQVTWFAVSEEAAPVVAAAVRAGDVVLVKGSRGIRTDVVVDRLVAELG
jgi:UDP-N-acetylmuramoyl-tripeptide--D-alanyl-D-alanine ligase